MPNRHDPGPEFNWDSRSVRARIRAQKRLEAEDRQAKSAANSCAVKGTQS